MGHCELLQPLDMEIREGGKREREREDRFEKEGCSWHRGLEREKKLE